MADEPPPVPSKKTFYEHHPELASAEPWKETPGRWYDRIVPPRRYCGLRRRWLAIIIAILLAILVLAIGLGVGLRKHAQNLPLPTNSQVFTGDLTYYSPALGSCGVTSTDNDMICAVSHLVYDAVQQGTNPNSNPLCGKKIRARRFNEEAGSERSVDLTVVDRCVGCKANDIDLSPAAFKMLANPDLGRVTVQWAWL